MDFFFWRGYFSIGIKCHDVWPLIRKLSAASITNENFILNGFSLPNLWSDLWVVSTWELMEFVEKWSITPANFNHLPWNFLQGVLSSIQVLPENFTVVAIDREEIHVQTSQTMEASPRLNIATVSSILPVTQYRHTELYFLIRKWVLTHRNSGEQEKCWKSRVWSTRKKTVFST